MTVRSGDVKTCCTLVDAGADVNAQSYAVCFLFMEKHHFTWQQ